MATVLDRVPQRVRDRFWSNVEVGPDSECWPWRLSLGGHGYGQVGWHDANGHVVMELAHRLAYALAHADIPRGVRESGRAAVVIDHLCHRRWCCNPAHLRETTNATNAADNGRGAKTHCPRNHEYAGANLYINPQGHRACRACRQRWRTSAEKESD